MLLWLSSRISTNGFVENKVRELCGPILVLGASGFVGANLIRSIAAVRKDVTGTASRLPAWRLDAPDLGTVVQLDLLAPGALENLIATVRPRTVFNCVSYGAYSFETASDRIYQTNFNMTARLLESLAAFNPKVRYIHAGSSSEYGENCAGPEETSHLAPNSEYAVSKAAASQLIHFFGRKQGLLCCNLRLYSVYGPFEDSSRLIPNVVRQGLAGGYPEFVDPAISRDFVYVDDVCEAFFDAALRLDEADFGQSFNIGTGVKTDIRTVAGIAAEIFGIEHPPAFTMPARRWDLGDWFANPERAWARLGWKARTGFHDGLVQTARWYRDLPGAVRYERCSKFYEASVSQGH